MIFELSRALNAWIGARATESIPPSAIWPLCLVPLVLAVMVPIYRLPRGRAWLIPAALAIVLFLGRLPLISTDYQNPDEALMLASAMRSTVDPIAYRSFDAATIGPLDIYLLSAAHLLHAPLTYVTARLCGAALAFGTLLFLFGTLRRWFSDRAAALLLLPSACFYIFAGESEFIHCSSEHLPVFLIALAVYLLSRGMPAAAASLCSAMVFGKLQSLPIAGAIGGIALWIAWQQPRRAVALLRVLAAASIVPIFFLLLFWRAGVLADFVTAYIAQNYHYTGLTGATPLQKLNNAQDLLLRISSFGPFFLAQAAAWAIGLAALCAASMRKHPAASETARQTAAAGFLALAAFLSIAGSGKSFPHYSLFLIVPVSLLTAAAARSIALAIPKPSPLIAACAVALFLAATCVVPNLLRQDWADAWDKTPFPSGSPLPAAIQQYSSPTDAVVVWGWRSELNVASRRVPGTRHPDSVLEIEPYPRRTHFREIYLADFLRSRPAVFVDAVGPDAFTYTDRALFGFETFPELRDVVMHDYRHVADVDNARLYVRKDR